jgi:hypothetical protein
MSLIPEGVQVERSHSTKAYVITVVGVLVVAIGVTWVFFSMRAVMNVGGSCADGGPYVSAQPCPDGAGLIAIAMPVVLLTAILGSGVAMSVNAPNLLLPMWGFLFGALGWNFLEYSVKGEGIVWGWLVCGVLFWAMAAPAVYGMLVAVKHAVVPPAKPSPLDAGRWWVPAYTALGAVGFLFGAWSWNALA